MQYLSLNTRGMGRGQALALGLAPASAIASVLVSAALAAPEPLVWKSQSPASTLAYTLVHPMHKIHGVSDKVVCEVGLTADTVGSTVACSAPLASFSTGNENRDSHMLETVESLRYPKVAFAGHAAAKDAKGWRVEGELDFHGVKKPLAFPVTVAVQEKQVKLDGAFAVSLTDHRIKRPSLLFVATEDTVRIEVHVVGESP